MASGYVDTAITEVACTHRFLLLAVIRSPTSNALIRLSMSAGYMSAVSGRAWRARQDKFQRFVSATSDVEQCNERVWCASDPRSGGHILLTTNDKSKWTNLAPAARVGGKDAVGSACVGARCWRLIGYVIVA